MLIVCMSCCVLNGLVVHECMLKYGFVFLVIVCGMGFLCMIMCCNGALYA